MIARADADMAQAALDGPAAEILNRLFERELAAIKDALGQVIIALKFDPVAHHQLAVIEEVFQRHLGRLPIPPAAVAAALALEIFRRHRSALADRLQHIFDDGFHIDVKAIELPLAFLELLLRDIGVIPGVVRGRQLAHGVRPGLKEEAAVQQGVQRGRVIEPRAREHDQVVAARDHADRIQLQQANALDDALERGLVAGCRALVQALVVDAEALDGLAADGDGRGHGGEFSMGLVFELQRARRKAAYCRSAAAAGIVFSAVWQFGFAGFRLLRRWLRSG